MGCLSMIVAAVGLLQVATAAVMDKNRYEPMVAFLCDRPAMHREVNAWIADKNTDCLQQIEDVLDYCQKVFPDHNITNVVEASYFVTIPNWPMHNSVVSMPQRIRPFRCLEDEGPDAQYHPPQDNDLPDSFKDNSQSEEDDSVSDSYEDDSEETDMPEENTIDLYQAYLLGQVFPAEYDNEHKRFLAAKKRMEQNQQKRVTKLLQDWQAARKYVDDVRKTESTTADHLSKEITERFQNLYSALEKEHSSQKEQLVALHLQHVQAALNDKDEDLDAQYHPPQDDDLPDSFKDNSQSEEDDSVSDSEETDNPDENTIDLYQAYLLGQVFPAEYDNEHKRFLAAKKRMKQNQQKRVTKFLQDWQAARELVDDVRKTESTTADQLSKEITERFLNLYSALEKEHSSQKEQLVALHLQHVQAALDDSL